MTETWSPRCLKCGGPGNAEVTPPPNMVFAGRLRPEATRPFVPGTRVRCRKCLTWFTIGPGTEWRPNTDIRKRIAEPVPDENPAEGEPDAEKSST